MRIDMRTVIRAIGSRRMATTLLLIWLTLLVMWIVPFEFYGLDVGQLRFIIYQEPFFRAVYILLVVNTLFCVITGLPRTVKRAHTAPLPDARPRVGGRFATIEGEWSEQLAETVARGRGYSSVVVGDGWIWAVKNRFSPWGHVMLHLGLILFVIAGLMSLDPGSDVTGKSVVVEGEMFDAGTSQIIDVSPEGAKLPAVRFTVKDVESRFHEDMLLFTRLRSEVVDSSGDKHDVRVGSPWFVDPFTVVSLDDFGFAPVVSVSSETTSMSGLVYKLKAFPSGTADYFTVSDDTGATYEIKVAVYGDYLERDGKHGVASFNLTKEPRLLVSAGRVRSDEAQTPVVTDRLVRLGEPIDLGTSRLTFDTVLEYGLFRITRMTTAPVVFAGLAVVLAGFVLSLLFPRTQALFVEEDGAVHLYVRDDQYRDAPGAESALIRDWGALA